MKNKLSRFAVPYEVWMAIFVVAPIVIIVVYAFSSADGGFSLENFVNMGEYTDVFLRSFKLALIATAVCLLIGYPVSYWMSREGKSFQRMAMVLIMLPMWMNLLLRTYSWMTILENNGLLNQLFQKIGLIALYNRVTGADVEFFQMINTQGAVVLGMVYNYLPFMILPIYSVIIKLDRSLIEAARDLGANSVMVFRKVILPLSLRLLCGSVVELDTLVMIRDLFVMIVVPAALAMVLCRLLGQSICAKAKQRLSPFSKLALLVIICANVTRCAPFLHELNRELVLLLCITLAMRLIGLGLGFLLSTLFRFPYPVELTVTVNSSMRNNAAAATLAAQYFPSEVVFSPSVSPLFSQLTSSLAVRALQKRQQKIDHPAS